MIISQCTRLLTPLFNAAIRCTPSLSNSIGGIAQRVRMFSFRESKNELTAAIDLAFPSLSHLERVKLAQNCLVCEATDGMLQYRLELLSHCELKREVDAMHVVGAENLTKADNSGRPVIYVTAHYGAFMLAALKAAMISKSRKVNFFYNPEDRNEYAPKSAALIEFMNSSCGIIHNTRAGILSALKCLKRGESLCIVADQINPESEMLFVPFFGRFYAAMPGTAFFADRVDALIVPCFARNARNSTVLEAHAPIDPRTLRCQSPAERHYILTSAIFAAFEKQIRQAPTPWRYWRKFEAQTVAFPAIPKSDADVRRGLQQFGDILSHDFDLSHKCLAYANGHHDL